MKSELIMNHSIQPILDKVIAGERLSPADGLRLLESHDLAALGRALPTP